MVEGLPLLSLRVCVDTESHETRQTSANGRGGKREREREDQEQRFPFKTGGTQMQMEQMLRAKAGETRAMNDEGWEMRKRGGEKSLNAYGTGGDSNL